MTSTSVSQSAIQTAVESSSDSSNNNQVVEVAPSATSQLTSQQLLDNLETQHKLLKSQITEMGKALAGLRRLQNKSSKQSNKKQKKPKVETPKKIVGELSVFMNCDETTRTLASRAISTYTKQHSLHEGRNFRIDDVLSKLLGGEVGSTRPYISVNGALSKYFLKK